MDALVSVNLTTYNRAHLLRRCLDSILRQSYRNFEVNIVDDCSIDNTNEVVREYREKDVRVRYFRHEINLGNVHARNTALDNTNGQYVAFMDDDDEWIDVNKLEKQIEILERFKAKDIAIVCTSVRLHSTESDYKQKIVSAPKDLKSTILSGNGLIYSPTVMTTKHILDEIGGFDVNLSRGVDSDFYRACIVKHGYGVYFMPDVTTAIYEYGDDRMTPVTTLFEANKIMKNNVHIIRKYFFGFIVRPSALLKRFRMVLSKYKQAIL